MERFALWIKAQGGLCMLQESPRSKKRVCTIKLQHITFFEVWSMSFFDIQEPQDSLDRHFQVSTTLFWCALSIVVSWIAAFPVPLRKSRLLQCLVSSSMVKHHEESWSILWILNTPNNPSMVSMQWYTIQCKNNISLDAEATQPAYWECLDLTISWWTPAPKNCQHGQHGLRPSQKELLVLDGQEAPMVDSIRTCCCVDYVDLVTSDLPHQIPHDAILKTFTFRPVTMQVTSSRSKFLENAALMSRKPFAGPVFKKELMKFGTTGPVPCNFESRARCFCGSLARKPARPGRGQRCSWETCI